MTTTRFLDIDLGRRQAYARRSVHGFQHIGDQGPDTGVDGFHRQRWFAQPGIRIVQYV
jgi:hypothetical protein